MVIRIPFVFVMDFDSKFLRLPDKGAFRNRVKPLHLDLVGEHEQGGKTAGNDQGDFNKAPLSRRGFRRECHRGELRVGSATGRLDLTSYAHEAGPGIPDAPWPSAKAARSTVVIGPRQGVEMRVANRPHSSVARINFHPTVLPPAGRKTAPTGQLPSQASLGADSCGRGMPLSEARNASTGMGAHPWLADSEAQEAVSSFWTKRLTVERLMVCPSGNGTSSHISQKTDTEKTLLVALYKRSQLAPPPPTKTLGTRLRTDLACEPSSSREQDRETNGSPSVPCRNKDPEGMLTKRSSSREQGRQRSIGLNDRLGNKDLERRHQTIEKAAVKSRESTFVYFHTNRLIDDCSVRFRSMHEEV